MGDELKPVQAGDPLQFSADWFNTVTEAAVDYKRKRNGPRGVTGGAKTHVPTPSSLIYVQNESATTLEPHSPATLGNLVIDPTGAASLRARRRPAFEAVEPVTAADPVVIAWEKIPVGRIGLAAACGVTVANVNVLDSEHRYARPVPGDTTALESAETGSVRILGPFATGTSKRYVLIPGMGEGSNDDNPPDAADCGVGCGWLAGLHTTWCLFFEVIDANGQCSDIDDTQEGVMRHVGGEWRLQYWEDTDDECEAAGDWADLDFNYNGGSGPVVFSLVNGIPTLTIDGIELVLDCCGPNTAQFSGGSLLGLCTGDPPALCTENTFRVRITCRCCQIDGWEGDGWYCVEDTGPEDCIVVQLTADDGDDCDDEIVICSGPFDTEGEAAACCALACISHEFANATATVTDETGDCTCIPGTLTRNSQGTDVCQFAVPGAATCSGTGTTVTLSCSMGIYAVSSPFFTAVVESFNPSPFTLVALLTDTGAVGRPCTGTFRVTITDP